MPDKKTCFVVMGFGKKTDYRTQRTLDLDKTYRGIIKPAVEQCGLECIRADAIVHSGVIDKPMYEQLLGADLVVADLSTSNENAIYELGVRHALCPNTTIVIAEDNFSFPFDLGHVLIRTYNHLGPGIDFEEAGRVKDLLVVAINKLVHGEQDVDSPVYTFLPGLSEPVFGKAGGAAGIGADEEEEAADGDDVVVGVLLEQAQQAREEKDFAAAKALFRKLHEHLQKDKKVDPYVVQQLALVTYKETEKKEEAINRGALNEARELLSNYLRPATTNDPETLGLWGAIHKRLWELDKQRSDLDTAVWSYERGFYLKQDYYNGINYAFMLNVRAREQEDDDEATADRVTAVRVRKEVLRLLDEAEAELPKSEDGKPDAGEAYWVRATRLEALVGMGDLDRFDQEADEIFKSAPEPWMPDSTKKQLDSLRKIL